MFSILRPSLVYTDLSPDIAEHDEDHDASEWSYSDKMVYRGSLVAEYKKHGLDVYWLYDDTLQRIGLAEHESDNHAVLETLWFKDTSFGTLLQEDWMIGESVYTLLSPEAYQDVISKDLLLQAHTRVITPEYIINGLPTVYECSCGVFFSPRAGCTSVKKTVQITEPIFIDTSGIMYYPPTNSTVWSKLGLQQHDAVPSERVLPVQEQLPLQEALPEPRTQESLQSPLQSHLHQELPQMH